MRASVTLFLVFALGYFFSALLRAITATLAPQFSAELGLSAADLGLLAGVFFGGFASTQLPLGAALDRLGPKRVLMALMSVAVLGCVAFAMARSFEALLAARALMGIGLSAGLMAALTCFRHVYSPSMQLRATSWMLMTGSLGMLMSTLPVHALLPLIGWRGLFWMSAVGLIVCVALLGWIVPRDRPVAPSSPSPSSPSASLSAGPEVKPSMTHDSISAYRAIWAHPTFRRMMPMGFWHYGGLVAVQTLWAGPWFTQVVGLDAAAAARALFVLNLAMLLAFAGLGAAVPRLDRIGWHAERLVRWTAPLSAALLMAVALLGAQLGSAALIVWCVSCVILSLCQPAVGQAFPPQLVGRALSAYNLVIFLGVFSVQWGMGLVIDGLQAWGWARDASAQGAFGLLAIGCVFCWVWFLHSGHAGPRTAE